MRRVHSGRSIQPQVAADSSRRTSLSLPQDVGGSQFAPVRCTGRSRSAQPTRHKQESDYHAARDGPDYGDKMSRAVIRTPEALTPPGRQSRYVASPATTSRSFRHAATGGVEFQGPCNLDFLTSTFTDRILEDVRERGGRLIETAQHVPTGWRFGHAGALRPYGTETARTSTPARRARTRCAVEIEGAAVHGRQEH